MTDGAVRTRRPPPPFRSVRLVSRRELTPHMARVTLGGEELAGFRVDEPAASVRLLVGDPSGLVIPVWNGNEFLYDDGSRPVIRTFTPRRFDPQELELDLDVVIHEHGSVATWVRQAELGTSAAVSGPGRGYRVDSGAGSFLLAGDETAIPAIVQLIESIPPSAAIRVIIEVVASDARMPLTDGRGVDETWVIRPRGEPPGSALVAAVQRERIPEGTKVWAAGEAGAMFQLRKHLFETLGLPRADATVRGYWKLR